ncbi:hypothetical protein M8J77_014400 [Diaphorina citri]|nr:hypothetical protein M8J77_014400 [Diaphorina citri]
MVAFKSIVTRTVFKVFIEDGYIFKGLALETMGPFCNEMKIFIDDIGNRLCEKTGDVKAKSFLYQRIGLAVQRGNGASVEGTFPAGDRFDEVFGL